MFKKVGKYNKPEVAESKLTATGVLRKESNECDSHLMNVNKFKKRIGDDWVHECILFHIHRE